MSKKTNHWYLSNQGELKITLHVQKHAESTTIKKKDCDKEELNLMQIMYETDTAPAIIARIMTAVWKIKGGAGLPMSKNILNS